MKMKEEQRMDRQIKKLTDSKLETELAFARSFATAPPVMPEEKRWLEALEAEAIRRIRTTIGQPTQAAA